jgi:tellurite resistance protein
MNGKHLAAVKDGTRVARIPLEIPAEIKLIEDPQTLMEAVVAAAYRQGRDDAAADLAERPAPLRVIRGGAA